MVRKKQFSNTKVIAANKVIELIQAGKFNTAKTLVGKHFKPNTDVYLFMNGWIAQLQGDHVKAIKLFERSLLANPMNIDSLIGLASSYLDVRDHEKSLECAKSAELIAPDNPKVLLTLATVISSQNLGNFDEQCKADSIFSKAYDIVSDNLVENKALAEDILVGWGACTIDLRHFNVSRLLLETAIKLNPYNAIANKNLTNVYAALGEIDKALVTVKAAQFSTDPNIIIDSVYQEGMLHLLKGNYTKGWRMHEFRLQSPKYPHRKLIGTSSFALKDLSEDDTVLVVHEQGIGDLLQFARYLPLLSAVCKNIDLAVIPNGYGEAYESFLQRNLAPYVRNIINQHSIKDTSSYLAIVPLLSLPFQYKTKIETIPEPIYWDIEETIAKKDLVGICWQGSKYHTADYARSLDIETITRFLLNNPETNFISLQLDVYKELNNIPNLIQSPSTNLTSTLATIKSCKLVVSVDTMIAHLSAGAKIPTWIIQSYSPDWRWGLESATSEWYPSVTNFRQTSIGDWNAPLDHITRELKLLKNIVD